MKVPLKGAEVNCYRPHLYVLGIYELPISM